MEPLAKIPKTHPDLIPGASRLTFIWDLLLLYSGQGWRMRRTLFNSIKKGQTGPDPGQAIVSNHTCHSLLHQAKIKSHTLN